MPGNLASRCLRGGLIVIFMVYPFLIYLAISRGSIRSAGFVVIAAALVHLLISSGYNRRSVRTILLQAFGVIVLSGLSITYNTPGFILQLPVFVSLFLLVTFTWTLIHPPSMIERYAMLFKPSFNNNETLYLRQVTWVWIAFFIMNICIVEIIVLSDRIDIWAIYAGFVSYMIMGFIFTAEYIVRRYRFREFQNHLPDRILKRLISFKR